MSEEEFKMALKKEMFGNPFTISTPAVTTTGTYRLVTPLDKGDVEAAIIEAYRRYGDNITMKELIETITEELTKRLVGRSFHL